MSSSRCRTLLLQTLLLIFATAVPGKGASEAGVAVSKIRLRTPAGIIGADVFEQGGVRKRPVVLVLHGAGGTLLDGPEMRRVARSLAVDGNAVYLLHYFDRTGTIVALDSTMQRHFSEWLETVCSSIMAVQEVRRDPKAVGIYGYSLGGFLALAAASDNPRVGAVVEHAGGVWNGRMEIIHRMPPVLMLHGERDARVPFARYAQPLLPVLHQRARKLETHFFPSEGHGFDRAGLETVRNDAAKFFRHYLAR